MRSVVRGFAHLVLALLDRHRARIDGSLSPAVAEHEQ